MSTNETKKPIGFDMELTDEQLKDVSGGANPVFHARYQCENCGTELYADFSMENVIVIPRHLDAVSHYSPSRKLCKGRLKLVDENLIIV